MQKQQMAHVVGVPKREPCHKCNLPIFLAERLTFGKHLFHRTCLKCARCNSQLTPGSFYETEMDGEFCCETCPDEEKYPQVVPRLEGNAMVDGGGDKDMVTMTDEGRKSFSEKLALFQNNEKGLLHKSLSDEEKSKSLKRLNALYTSLQHGSMDVQYKQNNALSSFMTDQVMEEGSLENENKSVEASKIELSSDEEEEDDDDEDDDHAHDTKNDPPLLPSTAPPLLIKATVQSSDTNATTPSVDEPNKIAVSSTVQPSSSSSQFSLSLNNVVHNEKTQPPEISESHNDISDIVLNVNDKLTTQKMPLAVDEIDLSNVTKEDTTTEMIRCKIDDIQTRQHVNVDDSKCTDDDVVVVGDTIHNSNNRISMVRSRLHQFEQIMETDSNRNSSYNSSSSINNKNSIDSLSSSNKIKNPPEVPDDIDVERKLPDKGVDKIDREEVPAATDQAKDIGLTSSTDNISDNKKVKAIDKEMIGNDNIVVQMSQDDSGFSNTNEVMHIDKENLPDEDIHEISSEQIPTPRKRTPKTAKPIVDEISNVPFSNQTPTPTKRVTLSNYNSLEKPKVSFRSVPTNESIASAIVTPHETPEKDTLTKKESYPLQLNPFGSDEDVHDDCKSEETPKHNPEKRNSFNPFDSSDDEIELEKGGTLKLTDGAVVTNANSTKISLNPFGSDSEGDDDDFAASKRTPVPTPRKTIVTTSLTTTPEPTPRMSRTIYAKPHILLNSYGSEACLTRNNPLHGSTNSLASSTSSYTRRRKGRAPLPPSPAQQHLNKTNQSAITIDPMRSTENSPSASMQASPMPPRKKRPAPRPPQPPVCSTPKPLPIDSMTANSVYVTARSELSTSSIDDTTSTIDLSDVSLTSETTTTNITLNPLTTPHHLPPPSPSTETSLDSFDSSTTATTNSEQQQTIRRRISLDASLLADATPRLDNPTNVIYRRKIIPSAIQSNDSTPTEEDGKCITDGNNGLMHQPEESHARQWQKVKENKESQNKNRQSQISLSSPTQSPDSDAGSIYANNKSMYGKWKRRKGPAPALPIPPRKSLQMLPLQEIRHELEVIEVQQQGLEKQGIILEKMIRERCEGTDLPIDELGQPKSIPATVVNTKEVEDLILQLFEIVNEKNELFRRQAELMYLRRLHRLEQEQADIEYEIRVLMAQPERNKTDSDKAREEGLIARKVEIVLQRNEVIDCLETDRIREAEEDQSIKLRLELHNAKRDEELSQQTPTKLSKKEKKKQREIKKLAKQKKMDADKDADESEHPVKPMEKKKKRKFLF